MLNGGFERIVVEGMVSGRKYRVDQCRGEPAHRWLSEIKDTLGMNAKEAGVGLFRGGHRELKTLWV